MDYLVSTEINFNDFGLTMTEKSTNISDGIGKKSKNEFKIFHAEENCKHEKRSKLAR